MMVSLGAISTTAFKSGPEIAPDMSLVPIADTAEIVTVSNAFAVAPPAISAVMLVNSSMIVTSFAQPSLLLLTVTV